MAKLGLTHFVISLPRVIIGAVAVGIVVGSAQLTNPQSSHAQSLQPHATAIKQTVPYTAAPQAANQPAPAPLPAETAPAPKPIATVATPHSTKAAPVVTAAASASVSGLAPVNPTPSSGSSTGSATTTSYTSTNWSGYMATTGSYTGIAGSWTVPAATGVGHRSSADATWIGIGGVKSSDLIQVGTQDTVSAGGTEHSSAFYELLPSTAKTITTLHVKPGDVMNASLTEVSAGHWGVTISDTTTGKSFTTTLTYNSSHSSAEWIEEDPSTVSNTLVPLDTFAPVSFTGGTATASGGTLNISGNNAQPITMVAAVNTNAAVPSSLGSDGASFSVVRQ